MLPMAVARSSSGGVAIRYVLPVLWMTSCLRVTAKPSPKAFFNEIAIPQSRTIVKSQFAQVRPASPNSLAVVINPFCLVCGTGSMKRSDVRPSVCLSVPLIVAAAAGLLLSAGACSRYRPIALCGSCAEQNMRAASCSRPCEEAQRTRAGYSSGVIIIRRQRF